MRAHLLLLLALGGVLSCDIEPLKQDELFPTPRKIGGASVDALVSVPLDTAAEDVPLLDAAPELPPLACSSQDRSGILSGSVVDKCTGQAVNALVGIFGRHQCAAFMGKGALCFRDLPTGCALTLNAIAPGFKPSAQTVRIDPGGTASFKIELERSTGICTASLPPEAGACSCTQPGCTGC